MKKHVNFTKKDQTAIVRSKTIFQHFKVFFRKNRNLSFLDHQFFFFYEESQNNLTKEHWTEKTWKRGDEELKTRAVVLIVKIWRHKGHDELV